MPGAKFTKRASTPKCARMWEHVYASAKGRGDSPGKAITKASGVLKKAGCPKGKK